MSMHPTSPVAQAATGQCCSPEQLRLQELKQASEVPNSPPRAAASINELRDTLAQTNNRMELATKELEGKLDLVYGATAGEPSSVPHPPPHGEYAEGSSLGMLANEVNRSWFLTECLTQASVRL